MRRALDMDIAAAVGLETAAFTSSSSAAASIITPRASRAAAITALPTRCVPREANEPMQCGPVSESAVST
jgi:hypothetical protein